MPAETGPPQAPPLMRMHRLVSADDFRLAYRQGRRYAGEFAVIYVRRTGRPQARVGVSVGRQSGTAVRRNRLRRRVREVLRHLSDTLVGGADLVVVPRAAARDVPFAVLHAGFREMLRGAGMLATSGDPA